MNKSLTFLLFLCFGFTQLTAQIEDFQSWNSLSAEWGFHKDWTFSAEQEFRLIANATRLGSSNTTVGLQYKINGWFRLGAAYRYTLNYDIEEQTFSNHRIYTDLNFRIKPGRFTLGYRARYQIVFQLPSQDKFSTFYPQHLRHRVSAKYNIRKTPLYPFTEIELYQSLNNPVENSIQKLRYTAGLGYPISNSFTVEAYYRLYQKAYYLFKPKNDYILGLSFNFSF